MSDDKNDGCTGNDAALKYMEQLLRNKEAILKN